MLAPNAKLRARVVPQVPPAPGHAATEVDGLSSLMEPLIMVVLGVVIGGLVVAMYLPIFKMGQVV